MTHCCGVGEQIAEEGVGVIVEHGGAGLAGHEAGGHLGQCSVVGFGEIGCLSLKTTKLRS